MKRFNHEKELIKIRKGNKKKIIIIICALFVVGILGYSFALYQVRHTKSLAYTTISDFKKQDIYLSVLVDGKTQGDFPKNNEGKIYVGIECDKPYSEAYFDNTEWIFHFNSKGSNKCTVKFETGNLPNAPELFQGMIPITYGKNGLMYVADTSKDWYNYQDHRWANAVLVDASQANIKSKYFDGNNQLRNDIAGKEVPMEEVLQMYVWIPRYKYELWNVNNESKPKQLINIKFEKDSENTGDITCTYTDMKDGTVEEKCVDKEEKPVENGDWYTHPAFKFGDTELKGIWFAKFELSDPKDLTGRESNHINEITILPDKTSITNKSILTSFNAVRSIELENANRYNLNSSEVDTHMMKNIEWGAVAYLTQSVYGIYKDEKTCNIEGMDFDKCEVWINNTAQGAGMGNSGAQFQYGGTYTGCVGDTVSASVDWNADDGSLAKCKDGNRWNENGIKASTTGNMYGIYDMSGGSWEFVMGAIVNKTGGGLHIGRSGFQTNTLPELKYYDMYSYSDDYLAHRRGHLGDATREILKTYGQGAGGWNNDSSQIPSDVNSRVWFQRGGRYNDEIRAGVFASYWESGVASFLNTFRSVLTHE